MYSCKFRGLAILFKGGWGVSQPLGFPPKVLYLGEEHHISVPDDAMGGQTISVTLQVPEAVPVALAELVGFWGARGFGVVKDLYMLGYM